MKCPCKDCLLVPICRQKNFIQLKQQCRLIADFLFESDTMTLRKDFEVRLNKTYDTLDIPPAWEKFNSNPVNIR